MPRNKITKTADIHGWNGKSKGDRYNTYKNLKEVGRSIVISYVGTCPVAEWTPTHTHTEICKNHFIGLRGPQGSLKIQNILRDNNNFTKYIRVLRIYMSESKGIQFSTLHVDLAE